MIRLTQPGHATGTAARQLPRRGRAAIPNPTQRRALKRARGVRLLPAAIITAAGLAGPSTAGAATELELSSGGLVVIGDAFANSIEVRRVGDGYRVRDSAARLTIQNGSPCFFTSSASPPHEAKCLRSSEVGVRVEGRAGRDQLTIVGGTRAAALDGEGGDDTLIGGPGPDSLRGGPGADLLLAGPGNDVMKGEAGPDRLEGGPGVDTVNYSERVTTLNITLPIDSFEARADDGNLTDGLPGLRDTIAPDVENAIGGDGDDTLVGNNAANTLNGRNGSDALFGRSADDVLNGGLGADVLNGNDGSDRAFYGDRTTPITVTFDGLPNDGDPTQDALISASIPGLTSGDLDNVATDVEGAVGGAADDTLIGDDGPNRLAGGGGDDTLDAQGGDDDVDGGDDDDMLRGGSGADDISGGAGRDGVSYVDPERIQRPRTRQRKPQQRN
jgi:Ca2+-binding RTX toxin-like protein